jgi:flavin-dependent dehydrogenase
MSLTGKVISVALKPVEEALYDVAIIGGGPAGSTCATLLKKYNSDLNVVILEREKFPRDHVGESLLPAVCTVLNEMGCWEKIEAAGFPIKVGATYRWGNSDDLWDFDFINKTDFVDADRPQKYEGFRQHTAFQVDRAIYDDILLRHAEEAGCEVREETRVLDIKTDGDRITGYQLENGDLVEAKYYVDASGASAFLRRKMGVDIEAPTHLRNIAIWNYWQNADWAQEIGVDGTRVTVLSLGYGWIWFIPLGPTRTSVGFVTSAEYFKQSGMSVSQIYDKALDDEKLVKSLMKNATSEGEPQTTSDWSFVADRLVGENWLMTGDCCGFADPVLAAGLTLAQTGAKQVAYTILEMTRGEIDPKWLMQSYNDNQRSQIHQHVKFADIWYSANGRFTDLKEYTRDIAKSAGLTLDADDAFRWLATGGFTSEDPSRPFLGAFALEAVKVLNQRFTDQVSTWEISKYNMFELNLEGAEEGVIPIPYEGRIYQKPCYRRDGKTLPDYGFFGTMIMMLKKDQLLQGVLERLGPHFRKNNMMGDLNYGIQQCMASLEMMVVEGWVKGSVDPNFPLISFEQESESDAIHANTDVKQILES